MTTRVESRAPSTSPARQGLPAAGSWAPIALGYLGYVSAFLAGFFLDAPALNIAGALGLMFVSVVGNHRAPFRPRRDAPTAAALVMLAAIVLCGIANPGPQVFALVVKYALVYLLFLLVSGWRLVPMEATRWRWKFLALCIAIILLSVGWGDHFEMGDARRLSGVFVNPNNLALMALALLFFVDERDGLRRQLIVHAAVVGTLVLTSTSGAILAYAYGLAYRFRSRVRPTQLAVIGTVIVVAGGVLFSRPDLMPERLVRQFQAIEQNARLAIDAKDIAFGELANEYGASSLSGIWRLAMWRRVVGEYASGTAWEWLVGRGLGASVQVFGILPHNDYLRLLFEGGLLMLSAHLAFFLAVWRTMRASGRYLLVMFLGYSLTENNLDNFLFMALLMFFVGASREVAAEARRWARPPSLVAAGTGGASG